MAKKTLREKKKLHGGATLERSQGEEQYSLEREVERDARELWLSHSSFLRRWSGG